MNVFFYQPVRYPVLRLFLKKWSKFFMDDVQVS